MTRRNKQKGSSKKKNKLKSKKILPDIDTILVQADTALQISDTETALQLFTYASNKLRNDIDTGRITGGADGGVIKTTIELAKVLGKLGEAKASLGDEDGGRKDFLEAVSLLENKDIFPHTSDDFTAKVVDVERAQIHETKSSIYLYLGQLCTAKEALDFYLNGIKELKICHAFESVSESISLQNTRRQLCSAYCSIAELYMTDLCYEEEAETQCESNLKLALTLNAEDKDNTPDAEQTMASLRLSQQRGQEAVPYILNSYGRMKVGCVALSNLVGISQDENKKGHIEEDCNVEEEAMELNEDELKAGNSLPGFEFRCQTAKILLECANVLSEKDRDIMTKNERGNDEDQRDFCVDASIQVLGSLLAENDEVVEIWYLLGCAFSACSPPNTNESKYYWDNAMKMLLQVKEGLEQQINAETEDENDEALLDVNSKIEEVKKKIDDMNEENGESNILMDES